VNASAPSVGNGSRVMTVLGPVDPDDLGITLQHEHLLVDGTCFFELADGPDAEEFAGLPLTPELISRVRSQSCSNRDNLLLRDRALAVKELEEFAGLGGKTVVDVTSSLGLGRDPKGLRSIAQQTSLHIVMGCGFYCEYAHPEMVSRSSVAELTEYIVRELSEGVDGIRAGIIGEIGVNGQERGTLRYVGEMTSDEEKTLRAAALACLETGAAIVVHQPNRASTVPEIMRVLEEEGAPPERVVLGHMSSVPDFRMHVRALERGYWIAYDNFGMGLLANARYRPVTDAQRVEWLLELVRLGYAGRVLLSHDVWCKVQLRAFGGEGYGHILRSIVPELLERGLSAHDIERLLVRNPAEVLAF
jgi:phosphotriesterase-related protein